MAGHNPRYECSLCDAKFEHDLKFPHLVGQKHRMNVLVSFNLLSELLFQKQGDVYRHIQSMW